jgi:hypothetical protein
LTPPAEAGQALLRGKFGDFFSVSQHQRIREGDKTVGALFNKGAKGGGEITGNVCRWTVTFIALAAVSVSLNSMSSPA